MAAILWLRKRLKSLTITCMLMVRLIFVHQLYFLLGCFFHNRLNPFYHNFCCATDPLVLNILHTWLQVKYGETLRRFNARVNEVGQLDLDVGGLRGKVIGLFNFCPRC